VTISNPPRGAQEAAMQRLRGTREAQERAQRAKCYAARCLCANRRRSRYAQMFMRVSARYAMPHVAERAPRYAAAAACPLRAATPPHVCRRGNAGRHASSHNATSAKT